MRDALNKPAAPVQSLPGVAWQGPHRAAGPALACGAALVAAGAAIEAYGFSQALMQAVHGGEPASPDAWAALTLLGFGWPLLILAAVFAGGRGSRASVFLKAALLAMVCAQLPKWLWHRPRPALVLPPSELSIVGDAVLHTGSMPSGHALAAFALVAAAWCSRQGPVRPWRLCLAWIGAWTLAAGVGWSRVCVGAHWPSDVLVGAGLGLWTGVLAWQWDLRWPWGPWFESPHGQLAMSVFLTASAVAWGLTNTGYPSAVWLQAALVLLAVLEAGRRFRQWSSGRAQP